MTYTWEQSKDELGRLLGDATNNPTWSEALRKDGMNAALAAFAYHTAVASATDVELDGATSSFALPSNAVEGVTYIFLWDELDELWWSPVKPQAGATGPNPTPSSSSNHLTYFEWPTGSVQLNTLPSARTLVMYYYAHWDQIEDDDSVIGVPLWAREALVNYAASHCLKMSAASRAKIAQFNQKQDSGNPDHNPFVKPIQIYMDTYKRILSEHNVQQKAAPYRGKRP